MMPAPEPHPQGEELQGRVGARGRVEETAPDTLRQKGTGPTETIPGIQSFWVAAQPRYDLFGCLGGAEYLAFTQA
ncbi:MAG: hypothetical protein ACP5O1_03710 [Phycisphaerae bacterium]